MIQQEIKLYDEPVVKVTEITQYQYPAANYQKYYNRMQPISQTEFAHALNRAKTKFKVGQRFRYYHGQILVITGFEHNVEKADIYENEPGVIQGKREGTTVIYNYSIGEIDALEEIKENVC